MAKIAKKTYDADAHEIAIDFANGKKVTFDLTAMTPEMAMRAAAHGIMQKLGDSYAGADGPDDGYDKCQSLADAMAKGNWTQGRTSTGSTTPRLVIEALARATKRTTDEAADVWNGLDEAQQKEIEKHPDVKAAVAAIRAERAKAKAKVSGGADLAGLFA